MILIEDNQYKGYGYLDALTQISGPEEFKNLIRPAVYYPDNNDLVRTWMQGKYSLKIIDLPEPQLRDTEF